MNESTLVMLALADGRSPNGGHTHSSGVEQAITRGLVRDVGSLRWFLHRRLTTSGLLSGYVAGIAARDAWQADSLANLDEQLSARMTSPASQQASRTQGKSLLRMANLLARGAREDLPPRPHWPIALGCLAGRLGMTAPHATSCAVHLSVAGPATAAQRLLALDPLEVAHMTVDLVPVMTQITMQAAQCTVMPAWTDPLADVLAEEHASRKERFFVS